MGPSGYVGEDMCSVIALRGPTRISVTAQFAEISGTRFGNELLQQVEIWRANGRGMIQNKPIVNLVWQHCLPLFAQLAPETLLQDLSLDNFLHSPTYEIEIVIGENNNTRFHGETSCTYEPAFFTTPIHTTDLPHARQTIPHIPAKDITIAPLLPINTTKIDTI